MVLKDTLGNAIILSIFDFLMGFVVLYFIGLLIRGLRYIDILVERKQHQPEPKLDVKAKLEVKTSSKEV